MEKLDYNTKLGKLKEFWLKSYNINDLNDNKQYKCIMNDLKGEVLNGELVILWIDTFISTFDNFNESDKITLIQDISFNIDWFNCLGKYFILIDKYFEFLKFIFIKNKDYLISDIIAMIIINLIPQKLEEINNKIKILINGVNFESIKDLENYLYNNIFNSYFKILSQNKSIRNIEVQNQDYKSFIIELLYIATSNSIFKNKSDLFRVYITFREPIDKVFKEIYIFDNNNNKYKFDIQFLLMNLKDNKETNLDKDIVNLNKNYFTKFINFFNTIINKDDMKGRILNLIKKNNIVNFKKNQINIIYYLRNYILFYKEYFVKEKLFLNYLIDYLISLDSQLQIENMYQPSFNKIKIIKTFNNIFLVLFTFFYKTIQVNYDDYKENGIYKIPEKYFVIQEFYNSLNIYKNEIDIKQILYELFKYFNYMSFTVLTKPCFIQYISIFIFYQRFSIVEDYKKKQIKSIFKIIYKDEYKKHNLLCFLYSLINKTNFLGNDLIFYTLYKLLKYMLLIIKKTKKKLENCLKQNKINSLKNLKEKEIQYLNYIFKNSNFMICLISFTKILNEKYKILKVTNFQKLKDTFKKILSYNKKFFNFFFKFNPKMLIVVNTCEITLRLPKTSIKLDIDAYNKISPIRYLSNNTHSEMDIDLFDESCKFTYSWTNTSNLSFSNSLYSMSTKYENINIDSEENINNEIDLDNIYDPIIYLNIDFFNIFLKPFYDFNIENRNEKNYIDFNKIFELNNKKSFFMKF